MINYSGRIRDMIQLCPTESSQDTINKVLEICEELNNRIDALQSLANTANDHAIQANNAVIEMSNSLASRGIEI